MNHAQPTNEIRWDMLRRVLSWPAGVADVVLARCPAWDQGFYCALGVMIWITSVFAGLGMHRMLYQISDSAIEAVIGGAFWSLCILNLDRFLLLTAKFKTDSAWGKLLPFARIALSILLAMIIGEHVVQYLFRNEITNELAQERLEAQSTNYTRAEEAVPELAALTQDKRNAQLRLERKEAEIVALRDAYIREAEGTGGSRLRGKGPLYEQKKADYDRSLRDKDKLQQDLEAIESHLQEKLQELDEIARPANEAKASEKGFLANHRALLRVLRKDWTLLAIYIVISLAMIVFEVIPLVSKLSRSEDSYDRLVESESALQNAELEQNAQLQLQEITTRYQHRKAMAEKRAALELEAFDRVITAIQSEVPVTKTHAAELAKCLFDNLQSNLMSELQLRSASRQAPQGAAHVKPFSVTVIPDEDIGEPAFVLIFQHPEKQLLGSDVIHTLTALDEQRDTRKTGMRLDECAVTNIEQEEIDLESLLLPQLKGRPVVYLSRPDSLPGSSNHHIHEAAW